MPYPPGLNRFWIFRILTRKRVCPGCDSDENKMQNHQKYCNVCLYQTKKLREYRKGKFE